jgi:hypothetical protein
MSKTKCSYEYCKKEFKTPVLVTNFSFTPRKETYFACPHCLTRIEKTTKTCDCEPDSAEILVISENEKVEETSVKLPEAATIEQRDVEESVEPQEVTSQTIENLEKQKKDLLAELTELRNGATKKISSLEKEVSALRKEAEILKKLTQ